jgi:hypothetical protein
MSRAANSLLISDVITTPIKLKYSSSFDSSSFAGYNIKVLKGVNGPITITGSIPQETLNYFSVKHLYYSNYLTGSFPVSASGADNYLQSTAASSSGDSDNRYFPTQSNAEITIISIPVSIYGQQISRQSFSFSSSTFNLIDDGNGNVLDVSQSYKQVGNIIYPQGMVLLTSGSYNSLIASSPCTMSLTAETTIFQNEVKCRVSENDFNYSQNPTVFARKQFITGSAALPFFAPQDGTASFAEIVDGTLIDTVTGSSFRPYTTTIGLYNENNQLLVIGKLATPYPIPPNTDMTFIVKWDS